MDCARCGGELETYSLGNNDAYVCSDCGFVNTPIEHEATPRPEPEPWEQALKRFHDKYFDGDIAITGSGETAALVEIDRDAPEEDDVETEEVEDDAEEADGDAEDAPETATEEREKPA